jgi:hypothetical protein
VANDRGCFTDGYPGPDFNANGDAFAAALPHRNLDANADTNLYTDPNTHTHADLNRDGYPDCNLDADTNPFAHAHYRECAS